MAVLIKDDSLFAVVEEDTEGVLAEPADAGDGYVQLKRDGVEVDEDRELKERGVFTGTLADADPRLGMKTGKGSMPTEARASGFEGNEPDFAILVESILPSKNFLADRVVTGTAHTASRLKLNTDNSDSGRFRKGDCIVVMEAGAYHPCAITAVSNTPGANYVDVMPSNPAGAFTNNVEIAKFVSYKGADSGHKSFSALNYWGSGADGGGILQAVLGARTASFSLEKFNTGELPEFKFGYEGLSYYNDPAHDAPHTPTFDDAVPGVVLGSVIYKDGVALDLDGCQWGIEQPLTFLKSTASASGRISGRASGTRKVNGSIAPYTDGESIAIFDAFEEGTTFALFGFTALPDAVNGILLGSVVMFYMPYCFIKKPSLKEQDGVMTDNIEFQATGGPTGQDMDFSISFV